MAVPCYALGYFLGSSSHARVLRYSTTEFEISKRIVLENVKAGYKHLKIYWRAMLHVSGALVWRWFPKRL